MRTEVLVIGGGATGVGVARDLSLRGIGCLLLEMGDYCHGASGGNHGLLHSGGRYAVKDPGSAIECASENTILKRIASFCIEDTGGLFVSLPGDDQEFGQRFRDACRETGVRTDEITIEEALLLEPGLDPRTEECVAVQDGSIDPFVLVQANVDQVRANGGVVHNHCRVTGMTVQDHLVTQVEYIDRRDGQKRLVHPEMVVNAAGSWTPYMAAMAGIKIDLALDQGSMLVFDGRLCHHVLNRLRPPSNGDIAVPNHTSTIMGTTSRPAASYEEARVMRSDVELLMREANSLLPSSSVTRTIRTYCGVRPLLGAFGGRDASRSFNILNDGAAENLFSVAGGKLTTYRLMAEKVADQVCLMLGHRGHCRTHLEELSPGPSSSLSGGIGNARLHRKHGAVSTDMGRQPSSVVCSCEQVLRSEVDHYLDGPDILSIGDMMRRTRIGMGYCQGLDCSLTVLDMFVERRGVEAIPLLDEFLEERERGQRHASGEQLRQELMRWSLMQGVYGLGGQRR